MQSCDPSNREAELRLPIFLSSFRVLARSKQLSLIKKPKGPLILSWSHSPPFGCFLPYGGLLCRWLKLHGSWILSILLLWTGAEIYSLPCPLPRWGVFERLTKLFLSSKVFILPESGCLWTRIPVTTNAGTGVGKRVWPLYPVGGNVNQCIHSKVKSEGFSKSSK